MHNRLAVYLLIAKVCTEVQMRWVSELSGRSTLQVIFPTGAMMNSKLGKSIDATVGGRLEIDIDIFQTLTLVELE